nr:reverse transcriptase domain-containing protein [Tanacetum cinerariifolium]
MDDPNITMEKYIRLEEDKAHRSAKVYNWETATYRKIWYDEDVYDLISVETKFQAIFFNDALTFEATLSCEPTVWDPRAIISDRDTDFCNDQFAKVMLKYGVTHRLATAYHPQTCRQVEVYNRGLKRILERTVGENHASWSDKLDDAL